MQQEQLNVMFFFSKSSFAFQDDGGKYLRRQRGERKPVLCIRHVGRHSCLCFCVFYRVTHDGDGQANRYFDFGRWFFSSRRRGGNGRGQ